ncbi:MAG: DUF4321 domain-containing protein [Clostridia bacterium]|nr:DUF4321 domain-containing protein [Clostridia bacterium]
MRDKRFWIFLIFIFAGIILGGLLGELASHVSALSWLAYGKTFGLTEPVVLDLSVLELTFKIVFQLNVASIIGIIVAIIIYKSMKV